MMFSPSTNVLEPLRSLAASWWTEQPAAEEPEPALAEIERLGWRCRGGDRQAWDLLFPRVWPILVTFVHRLYGGFDEHDAEDVAQASLEAAMRSAHTYSGRGHFRGWLFGIAARQASNHHRARSAQKRGAGRLVPLEDGIDAQDHSAQTPEEMLSARDRAAILQRALDDLSAENREIIQLHFFGELTCEQIGRSLRMPTKTVASRLQRSRQALLVLLRRYHLTSHDG